MMIHLETLMIWSLTAMTARVAGAHVFARERQNFPLRGRWLHPSGLPLTGQAPLRCAEPLVPRAPLRKRQNPAPLRCAKPSVSLSFAPQKTKASLTTFAHTKAFVMSVCSHALAQKTKTQKTKPCTKACFMWLHAPCTVPFGASAIGANAALGTQTTSA